LEQIRLDHERMVYEQNVAFYRELFESQREQCAAENAAREQKQNMLDRREETLVSKTKRYGQTVQYVLTTMPTEVGDLPLWFNMVENVWSKFEVPVDLRSKLIIPKLTSYAKSLITRLSLDDQDDYEKLPRFFYSNYTSLVAVSTVQDLCMLAKIPVKLGFHTLLDFTYYTNSRGVSTFSNLF